MLVMNNWKMTKIPFHFQYNQELNCLGLRKRRVQMQWGYERGMMNLWREVVGVTSHGGICAES